MFIALDEQKDLFRDEAAYKKFIRVFDEALQKNEMPMVLSGNEFLFLAMSSECAQQLMVDRILKRFGDNPKLLSELKNRISHDEIVD